MLLQLALQEARGIRFPLTAQLHVKRFILSFYLISRISASHIMFACSGLYFYIINLKMHTFQLVHGMPPRKTQVTSPSSTPLSEAQAAYILSACDVEPSSAWELLTRLRGAEYANCAKKGNALFPVLVGIW